MKEPLFSKKLNYMETTLENLIGQKGLFPDSHPRTPSAYQEEPSIVLGQRGAPVPIPLREIYFIESRGHTIEVHTGGETVIAYERLEDVLRSLPVGFYQCHKSFIVNMSRIRRFQSSDILLKNGERVPVSRTRYSKTREAYFNYIGKTF